MRRQEIVSLTFTSQGNRQLVIYDVEVEARESLC